MKKTIIGLIVAFCIIIGVIGVLPVSAATYSGSCGTNVTYTLNTSTGVLKISGTGAMTDYGDYYNYAPWYSNRSYIKSVTISDGVANIGNHAFKDCTSLTSVTISDSVTSIGSSAFSGCSGLASVIIPDSVTSIGSYAFYYCSSLTSVTIGEGVTSIGDYAFENCKALTEINWNAKSVADFSSGNRRFQYAGQNGEGIAVTFGNSVEKIPAYCFYASNTYEPKITSVTIGDSVTSIGTWAFYGCKGLTSVTIGNSVTSIGTWAFYGCKGLTNVIIPDSVTSIGSYAFSYCSGLTSVTIGEGVARVGSAAFDECTSIKEYIVDENNEYYCSVDGVLFNKNITTIISYPAGRANTAYSIPDSVTSIVSYAFSGCTGLTSVVIPESVTSIGNYAFSKCSGLTSVTIPDGVTSIGSGTFRSCDSLTSVTIGGSVTSIGYSAFYNCTALTDVYYNGTEEEWTEIVIESANTYLTNATIHYPSIGDCGEDVSWKLDYYNILTISGTGAMADYADAADTPWAEYAESITKIVIEDGVTTAGAKAFYGLSNVTEVQIADSVTAINTNAFRNCTSLTEITLPANVTELGTYAFSGCSALARVDMYNKVEKIGNFAFYNCKALTDVYYEGTQEAWANVSIGNFNTGLTSATIHVKAAATVTIDGVSADYNTVADAISAADNAGKAVEIKLLVAAGEVAIEPEYTHTIDLNGCTVGTLTVEGDVKLTNGTVTTLNVLGIVVAENVAVTNTNATASGTEGTKSVYTSYETGASIFDGAQVRIGGGINEEGKIDAESGLRFIGNVNLNDTLASAVMSSYYSNNIYADGYGIGMELVAQDSENKVYVEATNWQDDANGTFTVAITGLAANNFNRNYTARTYIEYDGVKIFEEGSTTRSMYTIASGLLINNRATTEELFNVLNAYVNQTGVRLTLASGEFSARMSGNGAYTGEAFFTVGETVYEEGMYMVTLTAVGQAKIDVDLFNSYVRINNNNSSVKAVTFIMDNEDGTYTLVFDYSAL